MLTSISSFTCILFYSVIAAQSISYFISLTDVQQKMNVQEYISFRHRTDKNFRAKFAFFVYGALLSNFILVAITVIYFNYTLLIASATSFIALVIDTRFTLKGNMPINNAINTWTLEHYPADWESYRTKWLHYFRYRQIANLTGFICLIAGVIFS